MMGKKRGRPPGRRQSAYNRGVISYILRISKKHSVNPDTLLKKLAEARLNGKSAYRAITVQCRKKTKNYAIFRITRKDKLVTQLRIPTYLLEAEGKLKIKLNSPP